MKHTLIILFSLIISIMYAQEERSYIRKGNEYYKLAKSDTTKVDSVNYQNAEKCYREAIEKNPNSIEATYNLGNALYKQQKFEDALTQYSILENKNLSKDSSATLFHNMGNSYLSSGKLDESIDAYKRSLKNNPTDKETKYNLAFAQQMKKKQEQQNQDNKDDKKDDQKDKDDKDKKDDQKKDDKKDQEKKDEEQQKQEQQKEQEQKEQEQKQAKEEDKKDQISKEDAARMLEALQNDEKELQQKLNEKKEKAKKIKIEKDW